MSQLVSSDIKKYLKIEANRISTETDVSCYHYTPVRLTVSFSQ